MIIDVNLLRSTFYFLEDLTLTKNSGPQSVDISSKNDAFIRALALGIKAGTLESNIELEDLAKYVKDIPTRVGLQRVLGLIEDKVIEVVAEVIVDAIEDIAEAASDVAETVSDFFGEEEVDIQELLSGTNKQVLSKIKDATLTPEQIKELENTESQNKNRAIILAAIKEL